MSQPRFCVVALATTEVVRAHGGADRVVINLLTGHLDLCVRPDRDQAEKLPQRIDEVVAAGARWMIDTARVLRAKESVYANGSTVTVAGAGKAVRGAHNVPRESSDESDDIAGGGKAETS